MTSYTATTVTFGWTAGSTETAWEISYSTDPDFAADGGTKVAVTTNPYTLEGLTAETTYYAYLRANYGTGNSAWSDKISFTPSTKIDLTINDGSGTNMYVPFYGSYADTEGTMSQFIIPAASLASMANRQITKLLFYSSSSDKNWGAKFKVYMKETDATTFASTTPDWTDMQEVSEATVSLSDGIMTINLDTPFDYSNKNLMIGFNLTQTGSYESKTWIGISTSGYTALYGYNYYGSMSYSQASFLPKMTITSIPASETAKMIVDTTPIAFGKVTPETAAADKQATFNIQNKGKAELTNINVVSSDAAFKISDYATSIAQDGEPIVVTVTMDTEEAGLHEGTITVTADGQTDAVINVSGTFANSPATMTVTLAAEAITTPVDFGTVNKEAVKTFAVANTGDVTLHITSIASDNTADFTVAPATLDVAPGESGEFTVTFVYDNNDVDVEKTANITLTASNAGLDPVVFAVKGTRSDIWSEDFEGGVLPTGWDATNWTVGTFSSYENQTKMALAPSGSTAGTLVTPCLTAKAGDVLTWDAYYRYYDEAIKVEWSNNGTDWTEFINEKYSTSGSYSSTYHKEMSFTAPADGNYYLRFTSTYQNGIDNIVGFKLAPAKEHDAAIASVNIPTTGNQYVEYTATVTVKEKAGKDDEVVTAELWIGTTKVATEENVTLTANDDKEISLTFTPAEAMSGDAYVKVYNDNIDLTSETTAVTINAALVLDENADVPELTQTTVASVVLKYTAEADAYNFICMPFALTADIIDQLFGAGAKAYELKGYADNTLDYKSTTSFFAGYPYIVKANTPQANELKLQNVYIGRTTAQQDAYNSAISQGSFSSVAAGDLDGKYIVVDEQGLVAASEAIKGYRGYIELPAGITSALVSFDGETTGIVNSKRATVDNNQYYNLSGQRVNTPAKGLYIVNGTKVVIK